jgi:glycerol-3-phosphate dehydrogenase (NAD(P)+)
MARRPVAIIGGGSWGLALAAAAARTGTTLLHSRRALNGALPRGVTQAKDFREIGREARTIVLAVPSEIARVVLRELGDHLDGRHFVVHGVRGLAGEALTRISEVVREETPVRRVGAIGGPALAEDLLAGRPSVMVCGSHFPEVSDSLREALACSSLRLYTTDDLVGLEWASALVGCLAIGIGYVQALGLSPGIVAAFVSRSVTEASKIAAAAGGDERTLLGLAGNGDLLACAGQAERPEVALGHALAKGTALTVAMRGTKTRIEAVDLIPRIIGFAEANKVPCPIFHSLRDGVLASRPTEDIVQALMTAPIEDRG